MANHQRASKQPFGRTCNFDDTQYQLVVYATDAKAAYDLRDACPSSTRKTILGIKSSINLYDSKAKLYGRGFDANWILAR